MAVVIGLVIVVPIVLVAVVVFGQYLAEEISAFLGFIGGGLILLVVFAVFVGPALDAREQEAATPPVTSEAAAAQDTYRRTLWGLCQTYTARLKAAPDPDAAGTFDEVAAAADRRQRIYTDYADAVMKVGAPQRLAAARTRYLEYLMESAEVMRSVSARYASGQADGLSLFEARARSEELSRSAEDPAGQLGILNC